MSSHVRLLSTSDTFCRRTALVQCIRWEMYSHALEALAYSGWPQFCPVRSSLFSVELLYQAWAPVKNLCKLLNELTFDRCSSSSCRTSYGKNDGWVGRCTPSISHRGRRRKDLTIENFKRICPLGGRFNAFSPGRSEKLVCSNALTCSCEVTSNLESTVQAKTCTVASSEHRDGLERWKYSSSWQGQCKTSDWMVLLSLEGCHRWLP